MAGLGVSAAALTSARLVGQVLGMDKFTHLPPDKRAAAEAAYGRMMKAFAFERVTVPGEKALVEWERLKSGQRGWPVVIGDDASLERLADQFSINDPTAFGYPMPGEPRAPSTILQAADAIRWPDDLAKWKGATSAGQLNSPVGEWPALSDAPSDDRFGLTVAMDLQTSKPLPRVYILLIPTGEGWRIPAYLRWGDWNACPPAEYHVAALRSWQERYGAELVGMDGDTLNIRVQRRPKSHAEALSLAREQYQYCPDIVDQGVGTLSALAAGLMASDWWFFWWD